MDLPLGFKRLKTIQNFGNLMLLYADYWNNHQILWDTIFISLGK